MPLADRAQTTRICIRPTAVCRELADRLAGDLSELESVQQVGPGAPADVVLALGGPPPEEGGEVWWLELVHSGAPGGSAFAALEIADDVPLAGIELCSRLDGDFRTLQTGWLRVDPYSPRRLEERCLESARILIVGALKRRARGTGRGLARSGPRVVELSASDRRRLRMRQLAGFATAQVDGATRSDHWAIGVVESPIERFLEPNFRPEVVWSPDQGAEVFAADPFARTMGAGLQVIYERFDFRFGRGTIAARAYSHGGWGPEEELLQLPSHLSYPFVIDCDGTTYLVPENAEGDGVHAYELGTRPLRWAGRILDFPCLDPTIFEHEGRWWLFGTDARIAYADVLHGWYSDDGPLGPWRAHELNPLKIDVRSSRPGGTPFRVGETLYRPAQVGTAGYGGGVAINRVDTLTPTDFRETTVRHVSPLSSRTGGLHTLSAAGDCTLVDGKLRRIIPSTLSDRLGGRLRRVFRGKG